MRGDVGARLGFYGEGFGAHHALAEFVAQAVHHAVVGAHTLLHDFSGDADHVGVANLATLDNFDDGHARAKFAGLRGHAHDSYVSGFQRLQNFWWGFAHGTWVKIFQQKTIVFRAAIVECRGEAGCDRLAYFIGD